MESHYKLIHGDTRQIWGHVSGLAESTQKRSLQPQSWTEMRQQTGGIFGSASELFNMQYVYMY